MGFTRRNPSASSGPRFLQAYCFTTAPTACFPPSPTAATTAMGNAPGKRKVGGNSKTRKWHKTFTRGKFEERHVDQVWEDVRKAPKQVHDGKTGPSGTTGKAELDADLPGQGQHYCIPCARYFQTAAALADHESTKPHKRRVKMLHNTPKPHNQVDAEMAAGMGRPDNGPRLRSMGPAEMVQ